MKLEWFYDGICVLTDFEVQWMCLGIKGRSMIVINSSTRYTPCRGSLKLPHHSERNKYFSQPTNTSLFWGQLAERVDQGEKTGN